MSTDISTNDGVSNSCWKKSCEDGGSFWGNFKNQMNVFIHTPLEQHKDCFKFTWQSMTDKFSAPVKPIGEDGSNPSRNIDSMEEPRGGDFCDIC